MRRGLSGAGFFRLFNTYLKLLVSPTFLAGQVQSVYTACICSAKKDSVEKRCAGRYSGVKVPDAKTFVECSGANSIRSRMVTAEANGIGVKIHLKSIVDTLAEGDAYRHHLIVSAGNVLFGNYNQAHFGRSRRMGSNGFSPPLGIPINNSNLRM